MQDLDITIGREEDPVAGNMVGHLFCYIVSPNSSSSKYYLDSLDQIGDIVRDYIKENFEDDGASICYRVR